MRDDDDDDDGDDDGDDGDDDDDGADDGGVDVGGGGCGGSGVVVELNFEGVEAGSSSSSSLGSEGDPDDDLKYSANAGQSISTIRLFFVQQISIFEINFLNPFGVRQGRVRCGLICLAPTFGMNPPNA